MINKIEESLCSDKGVKKLYGKNIFSRNDARYSHPKIVVWILFLHRKSNWKHIKDLNVRSKSINIYKKTCVNLCDLELGNFF